MILLSGGHGLAVNAPLVLGGLGAVAWAFLALATLFAILVARDAAGLRSSLRGPGRPGFARRGIGPHGGATASCGSATTAEA